MNLTSDINNTDSNMLGPVYHKSIRISILVLMIAVSVVGNTVVLYKILSKTKRTLLRISILFLNLAFSDLLVTFFTMTSQLIWELMDRRWIAGDPFCRVFKILQTFSLASSSYILVSITIDRHQALVTPLKRRYSAWKLVMAAWIASFLPSLPNAYVFRVVTPTEGNNLCVSMFYSNDLYVLRQLYISCVLLAIFIVPIVLLIVLYSHILFAIWIKSKILHRDAAQSYSSLPRARRKALVLSVVVITTFIVTNVPYVIQELILSFGNPSILNPTISAMFGIMSAANSAANPYIYLCFHGDCCWCKSKIDKKFGKSQDGKKMKSSLADTGPTFNDNHSPKRTEREIANIRIRMI